MCTPSNYAMINSAIQHPNIHENASRDFMKQLPAYDDLEKIPSLDIEYYLKIFSQSELNEGKKMTILARTLQQHTTIYNE